MYSLQLSFHKDRMQPLSDLVRKHAAKFHLTSETPLKVRVSIMSSRGLTHFDTVELTSEPYNLPYAAPWGVDWSVLQIEAVNPRELHEEPHSVNLYYSY
jgi:hypothetical protein